LIREQGILEPPIVTEHSGYGQGGIQFNTGTSLTGLPPVTFFGDLQTKAEEARKSIRVVESDLGAVGAMKVQPTFATPTLPGTQARTNKYAELTVERPRATKITSPGLPGLTNQLDIAKRAADALARNREFTITERRIVKVGAAAGVTLGAGGGGGAATGGSRKTPRSQVNPRVALGSVPAPRMDLDDLEVGPPPPIHAHLHVGHREIADAVVEGFQDQAARS